jgi:hypothetical protein
VIQCAIASCHTTTCWYSPPPRIQGVRHSYKLGLHRPYTSVKPDQCGLCTGSNVVFLVLWLMVRKPTMTNFEVFHRSKEPTSPVVPQHLLTEFFSCDPFGPNCSHFCERLIHWVRWFQTVQMPASVLLARIQQISKRHLELLPTHYSPDWLGRKAA